MYLLHDPGPGWGTSPTPADAQAQRFELKYLVSETTARMMRSFVRCHLCPDEFAAPAPDFSYAVHTLYLDSADLALYAATNNGDKNRFKLRVRFYANDADAPAFFEVKRRHNDCISKLRAKVRREAVQALIAGEWPTLRHLHGPDAKPLFALQSFCRLMRTLRATPRSHVAYQREAWMSPCDNSLRVTFDRQVSCEPQFHARLRAGLGSGFTVEPFQANVICELKFTDRMPNWCGEMIRTFGLMRSGAAKYAEGVALLGEHRLSNADDNLTVADQSQTRRDPIFSGNTVSAI